MDTHPSSEEFIVAVAQEVLIVVDASALAAGTIVPKHRAVDDDLLLPAGEVADEGAEVGMGEEGSIAGVCVSGVEELLGGLFG